MQAKPRRFHTIDGMRGVAALLVAAYHFGQKGQDSGISGYLAVDIFFVISGFVIALNYTDKLAGGLSVARFAELRLIRLYPLYIAGLALGVCKQILGYVINDPRAMTPALIGCSAAFGAAMLPSLCSPELYPVNGPAWSLFFELAINIVFALVLFRLRTTLLLAVMGLSAVYLACVLGPPNYLNVGWGWDTILQGVARTAFSFPAGVLIFRHFPHRLSRASWLAAVPVLAMAALIFLDFSDAVRPFAELLIVVGAFPILVMAGIRYEAPKRLEPVFSFLGDLSYPLYAIHWPLIAVGAPLMAKMHVPPGLAGLVFVLLLIPAAYIAAIADTRTRGWISDRLRLRRTAPAQVIETP